jgi:hypothetical protein
LAARSALWPRFPSIAEGPLDAGFDFHIPKPALRSHFEIARADHGATDLREGSRRRTRSRRPEAALSS